MELSDDEVLMLQQHILPVMKYIIEWEQKNGSLYAIIPDEHSAFMEKFSRIFMRVQPKQLNDLLERIKNS